MDSFRRYTHFGLYLYETVLRVVPDLCYKFHSHSPNLCDVCNRIKKKIGENDIYDEKRFCLPWAWDFDFYNRSIPDDGSPHRCPTTCYGSMDTYEHRWHPYRCGDSPDYNTSQVILL